MRKFTLNGIEYIAKPFNFNLIVDFEDMGISMDDLVNKPMTVLRAYVSICIGKTVDYAGNEMQNHIMDGGDLEEIMKVMGEEIEDSDFFKGDRKEVTTAKKPRAKKVTD